MARHNYSALTPEIYRLADLAVEHSTIDPSLYREYQVMRGLRDLSGRGVVTGLTEISTIVSSRETEQGDVPCRGELYYRGVNIEDLVHGFWREERFGYEEAVYLLLFGVLPDREELASFEHTLASYRTLPTNFARDVIMKATNRDIMNSVARSVLTLYAYDKNANDLDIPNVLRQCIQLIANFPVLAVYAYQAYRHYEEGKSLVMHRPDPHLSTAENILRLLRPDMSYTPLEARILDLALVLHAEHGGGNNSTFTNHVVTSSGTDTYSAMAASLCSLKGPKHGGANIKVKQMMDDLRRHVKSPNDTAAIRSYLERLLDKEAFDRAGLIYGMGHAVYSISDPRAEIFKTYAERLSEEKGRHREYAYYSQVAELAVTVIGEKRKIYKGVSPNIDFYSGLVYDLLGLPEELYTPFFAVSRVAGWSAHRIEELLSGSKIIRPAYRAVAKPMPYVPLDERG